MAAIGVNTVRVYTTEPDGDHDGCMQAFASQGIYVWIDLRSPWYSIDRTDPEYTMRLFDRFSSVIDAFAEYNNTLTFMAGNEAINGQFEPLTAAPYIKAVVRDLRAFRDARGYRKIPISSTSVDYPDLAILTKDYLACGEQSDTVELFGFNVYSWCGNSSYARSGYDQVYEQFQHTNIPALFTGTGCILNTPRTWGEVAAILGSVFPATFSGVIVYEWSSHDDGFGIMNYMNKDDSGFPQTLTDYNNLGKIYTTASPISTAMTDYTPSNSPPACPSSISQWPIAGSASLPTIQALNIDTVTARTTYYTGGAVATDGAATGSAPQSAAGSGTAADRPDDQAGLSSGAIAGIAVGGASVGIAVAVIAFFVLRRRRRRRDQDLKDKDVTGSNNGSRRGEDPSGFLKAELPVNSMDPFVAKQELSENAIYEAGGAPKINEMDAKETRQVHEMPVPDPRKSELEGSTPLHSEMR